MRYIDSFQGSQKQINVGSLGPQSSKTTGRSAVTRVEDEKESMVKRDDDSGGQISLRRWQRYSKGSEVSHAVQEYTTRAKGDTQSINECYLNKTIFFIMNRSKHNKNGARVLL